MGCLALRGHNWMSDFRVIHRLTWHHFVYGRVRADSSLAWAVQALQQLAVSECVLNVLLITLRCFLWVHRSNMRTAEALSRCFRFLPCSWPGPCPLLHCIKKCSDITCKLKSFPSSAVCISPHWKYMRKKKKRNWGWFAFKPHWRIKKRWPSTFFPFVYVCTLCSAASFWLCWVCKSWVRPDFKAGVVLPPLHTVAFCFHYKLKAWAKVVHFDKAKYFKVLLLSK